MVDGTTIPLLAAKEAVAYFRRKGFAFGFSWMDVFQEQHARVFTVAKAMTRDLLEDIRGAVDEAIAGGQTLKEFRDNLRPTLQAKGWWGKKRMTDPLTGEHKLVQLGSPRRLKTIFDVNMRTAYQAGRWERIDRQKTVFPFLRYTAVMDGRERPQHHAWNGTVRPVGDSWWDSHYPPCGWHCRCTAVAFNQRMMDRRGYAVTEKPVTFPSRPVRNKRTGEVYHVERGVDFGWSYNVGKASLAGLAPPPLPDAPGGAATAAAIAPDLQAFFNAFDLDAGDAVRGRVFTDDGGWPLAISLAWFQADGRMMMPAPARRRFLGLVGATIAIPNEIRWVWVTGADGSAMLFRRYIATERGRVTCVVDVGGSGWRFRAAGEGAALDQLRRGMIAWTAE